MIGQGQSLTLNPDSVSLKCGCTLTKILKFLKFNSFHNLAININPHLHDITNLYMLILSCIPFESKCVTVSTVHRKVKNAVGKKTVGKNCCENNMLLFSYNSMVWNVIIPLSANAYNS